MYATHESENDPSNPNRKNKDEKKNFVNSTIMTCRRLRVQHLVLWNAITTLALGSRPKQRACKGAGQD
jgi:hypothetical protein